MKGLLVALSIFKVLVVGGAVVGVANYFHYANYGNEQENVVSASYENNKNILGQYSLKVKEAAKVSDKYSEALTKMIEGALSSRYGDAGSQAAVQWISEQNPNLDSSVFLKIQQIIEAGRNEYQLAQTTLIDQCRVYKTSLGYLWGGFWLRIAGYPKGGLEIKCKAITSNYANDAYETGVEKGLDF